ncbi:MAG: hypothetical protein GY832_15435 [Chloroflexi bacterium]|nr:hypothetical protein [Chloroflexota bacterium]
MGHSYLVKWGKKGGDCAPETLLSPVVINDDKETSLEMLAIIMEVGDVSPAFQEMGRILPEGPGYVLKLNDGSFYGGGGFSDDELFTSPNREYALPLTLAQALVILGYLTGRNNP